MIFLIEYDRPRGELVDMQTFDDSDLADAEDLRLQRELELFRAGVQQREVVILQAVDLEQLKKTHLRYFADMRMILEDGIRRLAS
jgi:hypothetical protein